MRTFLRLDLGKSTISSTSRAIRKWRLARQEKTEKRSSKVLFLLLDDNLECTMTIRYGTIEDLHQIYESFERDFPENERKPLTHLENLMNTGTYDLLIAHDDIQTERVGYALVFRVPETKQLWIDFIAIEQAHQGKGLGSIFMKKIIETAAHDMDGVLLEVEIPEVGNYESDENLYLFQLRRIAFYERLGAIKLDVDYVLPSDDGGVPMYLYHIPLTNVSSLGEDGIHRTVERVYRFIHSDVSKQKQRDALERLKKV